MQLLIEGDFNSSFSQAENQKVIPTDTQKNICYVVAHDTDFSSIEEYGVALTQHMLQNYSWVSRATATIIGQPWERMTIDGKPHPFSFRRAPYLRYARVSASTDGSLSVHGGIRDYTVLKTTESGFVDYPKCKHTTLKETKDRFLSTTAEVTWTYNVKKRSEAAQIKKANPDEVARAVLACAFGLQPNTHCILHIRFCTSRTLLDTETAQLLHTTVTRSNCPQHHGLHLCHALQRLGAGNHLGRGREGPREDPAHCGHSVPSAEQSRHHR